MHRNTYIHSPNLLEPTMVYRGSAPGQSTLLFAGQITGTEGYIGSTTSGYVAGLNAARLLKGQEPMVFPATTMIGALCRYVTTSQKEFQPMKANYGLLPPLETRLRKKRERHQRLSERALHDLEAFFAAQGEHPTSVTNRKEHSA
jgi:methylenetetrahydrofolate--tRNA-(uracil-5-)-methyltransferase